MSTIESPHVIGYLGISLLPNLSGPHNPENHLKRMQYTAELVECLLKWGLSDIFVDPEDIGQVVWASGNTDCECHTPKKSNGFIGHQEDYTTSLNCITYISEIAEKYRRRVLGLMGFFILQERSDEIEWSSDRIITVSTRIEIDKEIKDGYLNLRKTNLLVPIDSKNKILIYHGVQDPVEKWWWNQEDFEYGRI